MNPKQKSISSHIVYWLFASYGVLLLILLAGFLFYDRDELTAWFISRFPDGYLIHEYKNQIFTAEHFRLARTMATIFLPAISLLLIFFLIKRKSVLGSLENLKEDFQWLWTIHQNALISISKIQRWILAGSTVFLIAIKIYLSLSIPFYVDEVFNFIYFAKQGFLHTLLYSNNHVAYNLGTALWWKLGASPIVASRLTAFLAGLMLQIVLYVIVKHYYDFKTAISVMLLTGVAFWPQAYSILGVAYIPMTVCVLLGFISLIRSLSDERKGYSLFVFSCVTGFCFSKLFLIPMIAFCIFWISIIVYKRIDFSWSVRFFKSILLIILLTLLFYLPMYLWSGTTSLFTSYIGTHDLINTFPLFLENLGVITETNSKSYLVMGAVFLMSLIVFRRVGIELKMLIGINLCFFLAMVAFTIILSVYPPFRALIYMNVFFYALIAIGVLSLAEHFRLSQTRMVIIMLTMLTLKVFGSIYISDRGWQNSYGSFQDRNFYSRLQKTAACIIDSSPTLIYSDDQNSFLDFYLRLEAIQKSNPVTFSYHRDDQKNADVVILQSTNSSAKMTEFGRVHFRKSLGNRVCFPH